MGLFRRASGRDELRERLIRRQEEGLEEANERIAGHEASLARGSCDPEADKVLLRHARTEAWIYGANLRDLRR